MSSSEETPTDLKGGHPPAVKAGGMRITQHKIQHNDKPISSETKKENQTDEEEEETEVEAPPKPSPLIISGAVARGDSDFPAASVKAFHEKTPQPIHENRTTPAKTIHIQQPRK